jgi:selenocysteine lyase/cysteine desulfurase
MIDRRGFLEGLGGVAAAALLPSCREEPERRRDAGAPARPPQSEWERIRGEFLYPDDIGYFNTGTLGATPRPVVEAVAKHMAENEAFIPSWDFRDAEGEASPLTGYRPLWAYRRPIARMIGAEPEEIAIVQNATFGMNFAANGLDLARGDEVLLTDQEHPGGETPWLLKAERTGIVVTKIPIAPPVDSPDEIVSRFAAAIGPKTKVLVASHLTSGLGIRTPAERLCALARERGLVSVIDGAQVIGQLRIDVHRMGCDVYITSPHKWLCAPKGTGVFYVRREVQDRVWTTLASAWWNDKTKAAGRFQQYGTGNLSILEGLKAAVEFQERIGFDRIEARDRALTARLRTGLAAIPKAKLNSPHHEALAASVTNFGVEGKTGDQIQDALWRRRIRVRAVGAGVRCGTHYYCRETEIDRLLEGVREIA